MQEKYRKECANLNRKIMELNFYNNLRLNQKDYRDEEFKDDENHEYGYEDDEEEKNSQKISEGIESVSVTSG
jgi:hypothetical protein